MTTKLQALIRILGLAILIMCGLAMVAWATVSGSPHLASPAYTIASSTIASTHAQPVIVPHTTADDRMATKVIHVGGASVTVSIADTPATQQRGLGGRTRLGANEGMLFIFPQDGAYAFWMKDMQFVIDIMWLSADGTIITIAPDVSPATYPHSFVPSAPARYVVELSAGFTQVYNVKVGDKVQL